MSLRPSEVAAEAKERARRGPTWHSSPELKTGWAGAENTPAASRCLVHFQPSFDWRAADAYLFDIDGTLLNSRDAVHYHAFHRAVAQVFGLEFRVDNLPVHGNTDVGILRAYLEHARLPEAEWRPRLSEMVALMSAEVERNAA